MKKPKPLFLTSVRHAIRSACQNKRYGRMLIASIMSLFILSTVFNIAGAEGLPDTLIRPMKATIKYRKTSPERPEDLSPNSEYPKQGEGILSAMQGEAYATLELSKDGQLLSPLISVGPERKETTHFHFPCPAVTQGTITVGWSLRKESSNGCGEKAIAYLPGYGNNKSISPRSNKQQGKTEQLADNFGSSDSRIEISPIQDVTLILIQSKRSEVTVDVLVGEITANLGFESPTSVTVGKRYTYSRSAGSSITKSPSNISDSPSVQKFLESDGWSPKARQMLSDFRLSAQAPLSENAKELLAAHNQCRARVGVAPLKWSSEIASFAQVWADSDPPGHNPKGQYGENMAWGQSIDQMVGMWCGEQPNYDPQSGQCRGGECGHFTQVVWSRTTEVGCGIAPNPKYGKVLVCNYNPPGNYNGERPY